MRTISAQEITDTVARLCIEANTRLPQDVQAALEHETCSVEDFKALLSPAAEPFLERMAQRATTIWNFCAPT